jgi:hypothetical protein
MNAPSISRLRSAVWALASMLLLAGGAAAQSAAPASAATAKPAAAKRAAAKPPAAPIIESGAVEWLKAASDRLAAAKTMSFTAVASYEFPSRLGPPILYTMRYDVALQRPDQLKVVMPGDGPATEFTFDGKEIVAFSPAQNLVAVAAAPATLEGALKLAYQSAAVYFPFTDLLLPDPFAVISQGAKLAYVIGPSAMVGGTRTQMIVWANDELFMQLWIGVDDKLPRRIRALYRNDPRGLRHDLELSNWQLDGAIAAETFATQKARAGQPMAFAVPGPERPMPAKKPAAPKTAAKPQ